LNPIRQSFCVPDFQIIKLIRHWLTSAFIGIFIFANFSHAQESSPRKEILLNRGWKFSTDPYNTGNTNSWFRPELRTDDWEEITVPHLWDTQNAYANYKGKAWYRSSFNAPVVSNGNRIFLALGEIGMSYTVYLNGKKIKSEVAGNYEEEIDITEIINKGENQLTLEIDNTLSWGAYWNWGGIRRPLKLVVKSPVYFVRQEIISEPDLKSGSAIVTTHIYLKNASATRQRIRLHQSLSGKNLAKNKSDELSLAPETETRHTIVQQLKPSEYRLWHFDHPHLYHSKITLHGEAMSDQLEHRFGIRKVQIINKKLYLNGEAVRLAGYNWVADDRFTGSILPEFRYKEDIDLMKIAGANLARLSHRPLPQDVMDYLDEKGILVFAEFNNWPAFMNGRSNEPIEFATKLVHQNFNHPSVIGWSVGNENGNLNDYPEVNDYTSKIIKYIRTNLDSTRLLSYASHTADYQDNDAAQFCDLVMINKYGGYEKAADALAKRYPDKAIFYSEYGGHAENLIYDTPDKSRFKSLMVNGLAKKEEVIGYSLWTFNDYRSTYQAPNPATTTPLHQNRQWGIVDVYRNKKRAFEQMKRFYSPIGGFHIKLANGQQTKRATVSIVPRQKDDIPAFTLKNYHLLWELRKSNNLNSRTELIKLDEIRPSSSPRAYNISWKDRDGAFLKVSLLSPTGYPVADTTIFLTAPPAPQIRELVSGARDLRILFNSNEFSQEYKLYYKADGVVKHLGPTIDPYFELKGLSPGKTYQVWLTALNAFGESEPSDAREFKAEAGFVGLPPVIWSVQPSGNSFFVGYDYHYTDTRYLIRYGTSPDKSTWQTLGSSNFSTIKVPDLKNGERYFFQLSKNVAFSSSQNAWGETREVTPRNSAVEENVRIFGADNQGDMLAISIQPVGGATHYEVEVGGRKGVKKYRLSQSASPVLLINTNEQHLKSINVKAIIKFTY
jgi:beta-galactosidase